MASLAILFGQVIASGRTGIGHVRILVVPRSQDGRFFFCESRVLVATNIGQTVLKVVKPRNVNVGVRARTTAPTVILFHGHDAPIGMQTVRILNQNAVSAPAAVRCRTATAVIGSKINVHNGGRHPQLFSIHRGPTKIVGILGLVSGRGSILVVVPRLKSGCIARLAGAIPIVGQHEIVPVPFNIVLVLRITGNGSVRW